MALVTDFGFDEVRQRVEDPGLGIRASQGSIPGSMKFRWKVQGQMIEPVEPVGPEWVQSWFDLDPAQYVSHSGARDFLDAKTLRYQAAKFDFSSRTFVFDRPRLSDWGNLDHPPVRTIEAKDRTLFLAETDFRPSGSNPRLSPEFQRALDRLSGSVLTRGNQFQVFRDQEVIQKLTELVGRARKVIWGSALLFSCEEETRPLVAALQAKAREGVEVRLMLDQTLQSLQSGDCVKTLRGSGIQVVLVPGMLTHGSAFHVKLWMRDFDEGLLLGANLIGVQTKATGFNHLFHDTALHLVGPAVTDLADRFFDFWKTYGPAVASDSLLHQEIETLKDAEVKSGLRGPEFYESWFSRDRSLDLGPHPGFCRIVTQDRHQVRDRVSESLGEYLKTAEKRVWFNSVRRDFHRMDRQTEKSDRRVLLALIDRSARSGVQVEMMVNAVNHPFTPYLTPNAGVGSLKGRGFINHLAYWKVKLSSLKALREGAAFFESVRKSAPHFRVWSYFDYSHVKNLIMDDDFTLAGSYNPMDERSADDAEIAAFCQDRELNQTVSNDLLRDLVNSAPYPFGLKQGRSGP